MKLIIAYIQPHKLEDVKKALAEAGVDKGSPGCRTKSRKHRRHRHRTPHLHQHLYHAEPAPARRCQLQQGHELL